MIDWIKRNKQDLKEKEKKIKFFNESLKINKSLQDDELYMYLNLSDIRLGLNSLPEKYRNDILFLTEYFKTERNSNNYKLVKKEFLDNTIFVFNILDKNPEFLFFLNKENQKKFKLRAIEKDRDQLKYFEKEDFNDKDFKQKIITNFKNYNESHILLPTDLLEYNKIWEQVKYLSKEQCIFLKKQLNEIIEKKCTYKHHWEMSALLAHNPYICAVIDFNKYSYYKDDILKIIGNYKSLYKLLPEDWKNDLDVIKKVIATNENNKLRDVYHRVELEDSFVLNEISAEYFFKEMEKSNIHFNLVKIRNIFEELNEDWRSQPIIIKSLGYSDFVVVFHIMKFSSLKRKIITHCFY